MSRKLLNHESILTFCFTFWIIQNFRQQHLSTIILMIAHAPRTRIDLNCPTKGGNERFYVISLSGKHEIFVQQMHTLHS